MSKNPTLSEKKLLNEAVTGETKRCLAIIKEVYYSDNVFEQIKDDLLDKLYKKALIKIIENSPYIEFHPELLKRIPKQS